MTPKRLLTLLVVAWLSFAGCNSSIITKEEAIGKYVNRYEDGAIHYVELLPSGKFLHYYKGEEGVFENSGKWDYHNDEDKVEISFEMWKSYGKQRDGDCENGCLWFVNLKNNELIFDFDLPLERNFKKE